MKCKSLVVPSQAQTGAGFNGHNASVSAPARISEPTYPPYSVCPHCGDQLYLHQDRYLCRDAITCAYTIPANRHLPTIALAELEPDFSDFHRQREKEMMEWQAYDMKEVRHA